MVQAYPLGQVINDVSDINYNDEDGVALIDVILDRVLTQLSFSWLISKQSGNVRNNNTVAWARAP